MAAKASQRGRSDRDQRSAGRQRLGLILFGALFVLLFVGFAVAQGLGSPSVPSGDVVMIEDVPEEIGAISQEQFDRALEQQAAADKLKKVPKPGDENYEEVRDKTLEELVNAAWLEAQGEELGITVADGQVEKALDKIKEERFPTPQAYDKFLEESKYTQEEVDRLVRLQTLTTEIQSQVTEEAPKPDRAEVEDYYEAEKAAKFTTKESRDVRVVINEDKAKVEAAKKELEKDNSPASWKKVATKFSSDPTTASKGGLQPGIQEEFLPEELKDPIFGAATNEVVGPIKVEKNYFVLEVAKLNPADVKSLKEAEPEIVSTLEQELQEKHFREFLGDYQSRWESRTYCADGFVIKLCANFQGSGHPAPPACYEEDPEVPVKECPAPVISTRPALPGSITPQKPEGKAFVQRPHPEFPDAATEQGTVVPGGGAPEGAPEGAAPEGEAAPEGAAPEGEAAPEGGGAAPPPGE